MTVDIPTVVGTRHLAPDPEVVDAIGLNHALESAIADLVDNSIDARARTVLIRFVRRAGRLRSLLVVDDGDGMDDRSIDDAMTIGRRRHYGHGSLGHFGMGLKAASLSQADELTVMSRRAPGAAVGRRWVLANARRGFDCAVLSGTETDAVLDQRWGPLSTVNGTVVRWDAVRTFPGVSDERATTEWLERSCAAIRHRLGLVFHRLISGGQVAVLVDVIDEDTAETAAPHQIDPVDPFAYPRSGARGYPKTLVARHRGAPIELVAHVWPRSDAPEFRLSGTNPIDSQGFYFYRHDRLLQTGGWNNVAVSERRLQLARVAVDIKGNELDEIVAMNSEKNAVAARPGFGTVVEQSRDRYGTTFRDYLEDARAAFRRATARSRSQPQAVPPGRGLDARVRRVVSDEAAVLDVDAVSVRWRPLAPGVFVDVDYSERTIWLNSAFRAALLRDRPASVNDAPVIKSLVFLLMQHMFEGAYLGPKDRSQIAYWNEVLRAAAAAETER